MLTFEIVSSQMIPGNATIDLRLILNLYLCKANDKPRFAPEYHIHSRFSDSIHVLIGSIQ